MFTLNRHTTPIMTYVMATTIDAYYAQKRERILLISNFLFREKGFSQVSLHSILYQAGISSTHIYPYFKDKDALIHGVVDRQFEEVLQSLQLILSMNRSIAENWLHGLHLIARRAFESSNIYNKELSSLPVARKIFERKSQQLISLFHAPLREPYAKKRVNKILISYFHLLNMCASGELFHLDNIEFFEHIIPGYTQALAGILNGLSYDS